MYYQDGTQPGDLWCYADDVACEADAGDNHHRADMFSDYYYSNDDLFELVWQRGGGSGGIMDQAVVTCHRSQSPPPFTAPVPVNEPEVLADAPSEDEMASWLSPIVRGEEECSDGGSWRTLLKKECVAPSMTVAQRMGAKDTAGDSSDKAAAGGSRRFHHGETHNLTEKRRRCKINERLKTLQQLVPGCGDKSNHASTLEQTIQYMKWLQHQVQAMSFSSRPAHQPAATTTTAAIYPVVQPPPASIASVVLGPLLPCAAQYPAPAVLVHAAPPLYPAPAAMHVPGSGSTTACAGVSHRHGSSSSKLNGSKSSSSCRSLRDRA